MRSVLVTGAFGGMGRAAVSLFVREGYRVFALDRMVEKTDEGVIPIKGDITSRESVEAAFEEVKKHTDSLYAIVHFAGVYMLDSLVEMEEDEFRSIFDVNVTGAYIVNKTFMPLLSNNSRILITTSELATLDPLPFTGIYAVTKAALDKYAYSLNMELQLMGIRVSVLRAGAVDTGMLGTSTRALDRFCEKTKLYDCNAKRFRTIVNKVEARCIPPSVIAGKALKILRKRNPRFAYSKNRNPLLVMLEILPKRLRFAVIKAVLKS